ncbi:Ubiquitin conjugation factor E4, partial [Coemansia sp. RSA 552]
LEKTFEQWQDDAFSSILSLTLDSANPRRKGRCFLPGVAAELKEENVPVLITAATLERVLLARLDESVVADSGSSAFEFLASSWRSGQAVVSNLCGAKGKALDPSVREARTSALREAQGLLVSYMGLSLQFPDMFPELGRPGRTIIVDALLEDPDSATNPLTEQLPELFAQLAARFADDGLPEVVAPIVSELGLRSLLRANHSLLQPGFRRVLAALDVLAGDRRIAAAIPHMATFDPEDCNGRRMQTGTALGPFLALSGFSSSDPAITKVYYMDAPSRGGPDREALHSSLRTTVQFLQGALFELFNRLVRSGPEQRTLTVQLALRTLATNALRSGMQVDFSRVVDDGFADNLASIWLRLAEPFVNDPDLRRIDRINPDWVTLRAMRGTEAGGLDDEQKHISTYWRELTRVSADKEMVDAYLDRVLQPAASLGQAEGGFIPDCFFTTATALHLGPISTSARYVDLLKRMSRLKEYADQLNGAEFQATSENQARTRILQERCNLQMEELKRERCAMEAQVLDPRRLAGAMVFYRFAMCFLLRQIDQDGMYPQRPLVMPSEADQQGGVPERWRMLPEFLIEDPIEFIVFVTKYDPNMLLEATAQVGHAASADGVPGLRTFYDILPLYVVTLLARPGYVHNPYLKAKLVDILHMLTFCDPGEDDDYVDTLGGNPQGTVRLHPAIYQFRASLDDNAMARAYLVPALLRFYVDIEKTGASSQFYDKFNIRYHIARTLRALWARGPRYVEATRRFFLQAIAGGGESATTTGSVQRDQRVIEEFVARLMTDTTYLLDESLSKLATIRDIEKRQRAESASPAAEAGAMDEDGGDGQEDDSTRLQEASRMAQSYVSLAHETVHMLAFLSRLVPRPFQAAEVVGRLAAMLNYNLEQLAGPKCANLKVQDMQAKYSFNPRVLLSELTSVYVHLGLAAGGGGAKGSAAGAEAQREEEEAVGRFVMAVVEDDRSYSALLFQKAYGRLEQRSLKDEGSLARFRQFAQKCEGAKVDSRAMEFLESQAPDEYLDPLLASLISNPVRLPTSDNIMDLAVIKGQLLSDPRDPFNRAPLSVDMLEPLPDMQREIAEWRQRKLAEYNQQK